MYLFYMSWHTDTLTVRHTSRGTPVKGLLAVVPRLVQISSVGSTKSVISLCLSLLHPSRISLFRDNKVTH